MLSGPRVGARLLHRGLQRPPRGDRGVPRRIVGHLSRPHPADAGERAFRRDGGGTAGGVAPLSQRRRAEVPPGVAGVSTGTGGTTRHTPPYWHGRASWSNARPARTSEGTLVTGCGSPGRPPARAS